METTWLKWRLSLLRRRGKRNPKPRQYEVTLCLSLADDGELTAIAQDSTDGITLELKRVVIRPVHTGLRLNGVEEYGSDTLHVQEWYLSDPHTTDGKTRKRIAPVDDNALPFNVTKEDEPKAP
jgi:hypothetical protein